MAHLLKKALIGTAAVAGTTAWSMAPRSFGNKRTNYVPAMANVWYAHRGLHDAGSGMGEDFAGDANDYIALARRMAMKAGYGDPSFEGPIAPENSIAAFAAAAEAGYGMEMDLQLTRDGQVVVCHDADLLRVAGDPREIKDLTYDELVRIPLFYGTNVGASQAHPVEGAGENPPLVVTPDEAPKGYYQHVPLLSDVLKVVDGRAPMIIEFKFKHPRNWDSRDEELMEKASALLAAYNGPYVVESFSPAAMNWYKENRPEVCRGQLAEYQSIANVGIVEWAAGLLCFNWLSRPDFVAYDWKDGYRPQLRFVRMLGAKTVAWTLHNDHEYDVCRRSFDRFIFESFVPTGSVPDVFESGIDVEAAAGGAMANAQKVADSVKQHVSDLKELAEQQELVNTVKNTVSDLAERPEVRKAVDTAKQTVSGLAERPEVRKAVDTAKQTVSDLAERPEVRKAVDTAKQAAQNVKETVKDTMDHHHGFSIELGPESAESGVIEGAFGVPDIEPPADEKAE